jgi:hypothetical protein
MLAKAMIFGGLGLTGAGLLLLALAVWQVWQARARGGEALQKALRRGAVQNMAALALAGLGLMALTFGLLWPGGAP